jgi:4,5-dihydroxyphthalate decarboxylase
MESLTVALSATDRTWPILSGELTLPGFRLRPTVAAPEDIFALQAREGRFDVAEFSFASYLVSLGRGDRRFVAVPVFLSRMFRQSCVYVRAESSLSGFGQLRGLRVGVPEYQMTAAVWVRGLLREEYGIGNSENEWVTFRPERIPVPTPARPGRAADVFEALTRGEVDVAISARRPPPELMPLSGEAGVLRRLLPNPWEEERRYFGRTRLFPIMHLVVLRRELAERWPDLPRALYNLFCEARDRALKALFETVTLAAASPWLVEGAEVALRLMGPNLWPYGIGSNLGEVEALNRYLVADGLLDRPLAPEEAFAAGTLDT